MKEAYKMPAGVRGKLWSAAEGDTLHFMVGGEKLYFVTGLKSVEGRWGTTEATTDGVRPMHIGLEDAALYDGRREYGYASNHKHGRGMLVTAGLVCGAEFVGDRAAKDYIKALVESGELVEVGETKSDGFGPESPISFVFSKSGIDAMVDLPAFAESRLVREMNGYDEVPPADGPLVFALPGFVTFLNGKNIREIGAGYLLPIAFIEGGQAAVEANGMKVCDGGEIVGGEIRLCDAAADALRDMAVLARSVALYPEAGGLSAPEVRAREARLSRMFR